jgi:hypothetical protein
MKPRLLAVLWLTYAASALGSQALWFPDGLSPYRINRVAVQGAKRTNLQLFGVRVDGRRVNLFSGNGVPWGDYLLVYCYLEDDVLTVEAELTASSGRRVHLSEPVRWPRFRIGIYGFPGPLDIGGPWHEVRSREELRPGDVYVLQPGEDAEALLAAGIHVLSAEAPPLQETPSPWRGHFLRAAVADSPGLAEALKRYQDLLVELKQRYRTLVTASTFLGSRIAHSQPLSFPPATPAGIARTLQSELLGDRIGSSYRYALLSVSLALILAVAIARRWQVLLPLVGCILAAFASFSVIAPPSLRSLIVELSLPASIDGPPAQPVSLRRLSPPSVQTVRLRQEGIPPGSWSLMFQSLLAPGGEIPLQGFAGEDPLRFNQVPLVRSTREGVHLCFRNPLSTWSLHEQK